MVLGVLARNVAAMEHGMQVELGEHDQILTNSTIGIYLELDLRLQSLRTASGAAIALQRYHSGSISEKITTARNVCYSSK